MIDLYDLDVEAAVISAVLLAATPEGGEPGALATARTILSPEHFYSEAHRRVFETCIALADANEPVDAVLVASRLRDQDRLARVGGLAYLTQIIGAAPAVTHVKGYARIVRRLAERREIASRLEQAALEIRAGLDTAEVIERMRGEIDGIVRNGRAQ